MKIEKRETNKKKTITEKKEKGKERTKEEKIFRCLSIEMYFMSFLRNYMELGN